MGAKAIAEVTIPPRIREPLAYAIPERLGGQAELGMRVLVPLGKRNVTGVITGFRSQAAVPELREAIELLETEPALGPGLLALCRWAADYYAASLAEVLAAALPASLRVESRRRVVLRQPQAVRDALAAEIVALLEAKGKLPLKTLASRFAGRGFYRAFERLLASGAVEIEESWRGRRRRGAPLGFEAAERRAPVSLTREQQEALAPIRRRLESGGFETFLLFGVTGSGKTEVYLRAAARAVALGRRALILVPEIALAPQLLDRLHAGFPGKVGVLHSGLTPAERWSQWWRVRRGEVSIVVGARSAVFAPVPELGLIVVDEEHDGSYKQAEGLRYHARDLAVVRGKIEGCPVLLGSATPALESFENCRRSRYRLLRLTQRIEQRELPAVAIVDLRRGAGGRAGAGLVSEALRQALEENLLRRRQSLIFFNRRGYANFLQCRLCGFVLRCRHCSVTLTLHLRERAASCHHCGFRAAPPDLCPGCENPTLLPVGAGTERIERELRSRFPEARIERMDRDTTRARGSQASLLRRWQRGEIDILIGTQMVAKGHDVAGVTLVGVPLADLSLNLPDFRAAERTFQLLSQVAGRAGRGEEPGRVIVQTFAPDHYAVRHVARHDYASFFAEEIEFRRQLGYPPFGRLVLLSVEGPKAAAVEAKAAALARMLRARARDGSVEVLGPAAPPIEKLRGRHRRQILLKGRERAPLQEMARAAAEQFSSSAAARLFVDVDPYHML
jgi:primosomal protein N' (replication factor Y)